MNTLHTLLIIIIAILSHTHANNYVTGKVRSKVSGEPLPGANILIKGTSNGTTTDSEGKFKLKLDSGDRFILQVKYFGFKTFELNISKTIQKEDILSGKCV